MALAFVPAGAQHVAVLQSFILDHGANVWNWLPEDGIAGHMQDIAAEKAHGVLAMDGDQLVGAVTYCSTLDFSRYQSAQRQDAPHGYICEAVVRRDQVGRGLGAQLLARAVQALQGLGLQEIYIDRHEENAASAGMMRKAGFVELATFAEPARRPHGSGRTTVCRLLA
ncbi:GNAT family N-acetyltransferase [Rhodoferax lacus]|uniref:GNAT family N-acetyltransferase n=1 Tax=Rhodoferax lacus TaxID=2184758 RepID=A0A3E1RF93_9BURK|nr:GNAT family N-acetyltransferase [Rhodoferax lacus]RFO98037.1 GNAT family N-acetyltransferase [Rhodoferax lacus]